MCRPISFSSVPGASVANVTSTTTAMSGRSEYAVVRAPPKVISSCVTAAAATSPGAPPASATSRAASSATKQPSRLSIEREITRSFGNSTGSPAITATSPIRTSERASSPSFAPMSMCRFFSSGACLRSSSLSRWIGFLPTTPGIGPLRVAISSRWPTRITGSQPPTPVNHRNPSSSMWWTIRPISSMWPMTATNGPSPVPFTRATVEPTVSWVISAKAPAASRNTAAAPCS